MSQGTGFTADATKLMRTLSLMPQKVQRRVAGKAVRAGGKPILQAQKAGVAVDKGTLKKSLGVKVKTYRRSLTALSMIGPRVSGKYAGFHGHLIERGHIAVDGSFVSPKPFMQPANDTAGPAAEAAMIASVRVELPKAIAEANR